MIGVLKSGDQSVVFESSTDVQRTWDAMSRTLEARWTTHPVFKGKPVSEFLGPGLDQISMSIRLDIDRGVIPRDEYRKYREFCDSGSVLQFTVGDSFVGDYKLVGLTQEIKRVDRNGVVLLSHVGFRLEEYV